MAMSRRGERDRGKERFWRRLLRRWRGSGRTVRGFCAEQGVSEPTFYAWRRTIATRDQEAGPQQPARLRTGAPRGRGRPAFVPVQVRPTTALEVVLGGGRLVRVPAGFDPATLRQLLAVLEEPPC
jgi:hypothetical protein